MEHVNIFVYTDCRSPKPKKGHYIYVLEVIRDGEPHTVEGMGEIEDNWIGATLEAIRVAAGRINQKVEVAIWEDNPYVAINFERALEWQKEDFKDASGQKRKHWERWDEILKALDGCPTKIASGDNAYTSWMKDQIKKVAV